MNDAHRPHKYRIPSCHTAPKKKKKSNKWAKDSSCNFPTHGRFLAHGSSFFLSSMLFISWQQHLDVRPPTEPSTGQQNFMGLSTRSGMSCEQQIWQKHWGEYCSCKWLAQVKGNGVRTSCLLLPSVVLYPHSSFSITQLAEELSDTRHLSSLSPRYTCTHGRVKIVTGWEGVRPYSFQTWNLSKYLRENSLCINSLTHLILPVWTVINPIQCQLSA